MKNNENEQSESPTKPRQILSAVRQFMYPEEFRIGPPVWPPDLRGLIEKLAGATSQATAAADSQPAGQEAANEELMRFVVGLLAEVGTGIWRMKQKMVKPGTSEPLEETRRAYRHLESTWDVLTQAGVQIIDHTYEV